MPYDFDWLDEDRRILAIRLYSPLLDEEITELHAKVMPLTDVPDPVYVLADIRNFDLMQSYSQLGKMMKSLSLPRLDGEQMRRSRIAVLGGGPLVSLALSFAEGIASEEDEEDPIKAFKHEDKAYVWLLEAAGNQPYA